MMIISNIISSCPYKLCIKTKAKDVVKTNCLNSSHAILFRVACEIHIYLVIFLDRVVECELNHCYLYIQVYF